MLALLPILFAMALLGLTVYALHRYQTMKVEFNVDRNVPLLPLDIGANSSRPVVEIKPSSSTQSKPPAAAKPPAQTEPVGATAKSWQGAVTALKNAGNYAEATRLCEQQLPLWGAYNQLCMLIRSEMKATLHDPKAQSLHIARLFKTACIAEFLHDKSRDSDKLLNNQLRELDLSEVSRLDFPYVEIGYAHLRLIRKSDIKHMVELWGRPAHHRTPREYHAAWWQHRVKS